MTRSELFSRIFNKKVLLTLTLALLFLIAGFFVSKFFLNRITAKEFVGNIQKIEGNTIYVKGLYVVPEKPELADQQRGFTQEVQVLVSQDTQLIKIVLHMPTIEELKKTNGRWDPNKLPKEEVPANIEELTNKKEGLIIHVLTKNNIFKKSKFVAKRIEFVQEVYPGRPF